ncbi:XRE family transcriptional regulator [Nesterenkonia haasae]|uniref:XRE family transcriptional regulator n=1 Tax=Nesterenkonia haasae TaxID=2587813 RepID=UPI001391A18C|nr:XRE family transcriptional regulator [Nesterenkonia haasae]NDK31714.1 helix-turn-helix transcriptional regulator [Nesterenkonia haasae]
MNTEHLGFRLGEAIRRRRKDARLTLTQVARRADISVSHLSNIENGLSIASLPLLAKVAAALNTSLAELTRDENRLVVQQSHLPGPREGWRELSHPSLETRIMAGAFDAGDNLDFPLPLSGHDCFLTMLSGSAVVTIDGAEYSLAPGDALDARSVLSAMIHVTEDADILVSTTPSSGS